MESRQNTSKNIHIINVNDNSKWDTRDDSISSNEFSQELDNPFDASVPGALKINNGTTYWDKFPPISAAAKSDRVVPDVVIPVVEPAVVKIDPAIVEIQPYNPAWTIAFEEEANKLKAILGPEIIITIYHIGSTSVPGLPAKPIIDMIPVVYNILAMDHPVNRSKLESLGYEYKGENGIPFRRFYTKNHPTIHNRRTHHLHVYQLGNPEIEHHLQFCNYLKSPMAHQQNDLIKYAQLKMELANKYPNDIKNYSLGKSHFITTVQSKLNFDGILFRNCYTDEEWIGFKKLIRMAGNEPILCSSLSNHYYFVLIYRFEVVAAAVVGLKLESNYFQIINIQVDEKWLGHGFELKMEQNILQWKSHQDYLRLSGQIQQVTGALEKL